MRAVELDGAFDVPDVADRERVAGERAVVIVAAAVDGFEGRKIVEGVVELQHGRRQDHGTGLAALSAVGGRHGFVVVAGVPASTLHDRRCPSLSVVLGSAAAGAAEGAVPLRARSAAVVRGRACTGALSDRSAAAEDLVFRGHAERAGERGEGALR